MKKDILLAGAALVLVLGALTGILGKVLAFVGVTPDAIGLADGIGGLATLGVAGASLVLAPASVLSRAEILGRLGMMPMAKPGNRFALSYLATAAFLRQVDEVALGTRDVIHIPATEAEVAQFDWTSIEAQAN